MAEDVRLLTPADLDPVGASLGRAFADDPVMAYLAPGIAEHERARRLSHFFRAEAKQRARLASVWVSPGVEGAAIWAPPGQWKSTFRDLVGLTVPMIRGARSKVLRAITALSTVEKAHPTEPHWYLAVLGTDPAHQGKGIGAAVLTPVLERCDREGLPAYLESSKPENVPYYERFGFAVTGEVTLAKGGPTLPLMWREPR